MKKLLFLAFMLCSSLPLIHAQDEENVKIVLVKEENSDNYYYEGVVPVEGVSKEEMFKRAKSWVLSTFKTEDNNAVFDEANLEIYNTPTILVKSLPKRKDDFVNFKIKILFKDGRYKFHFDNLIIKSNLFTPSPPPSAYKEEQIFKGYGGKYNRVLVANINNAMSSLATQLENAVNGKTSEQKEDW